MRVYIEAASQAHERLNVLTEIMFADALKKAKELDDEFEKTGKVTGICESRPRSRTAAAPLFLTVVSLTPRSDSTSARRTRLAQGHARSRGVRHDDRLYVQAPPAGSEGRSSRVPDPQGTPELLPRSRYSDPDFPIHDLI